jgi:glycosyltransferase involved in cell wall biosynthesis
MNYRPNSDGVLWFHRTILPLIRQQVPEVRLYVVGWDPPPQITALNADPHVTVTGFVEDVRPYLANSAVVLVPIRFGSGTRLKILDAWAMGKAVVSTHLGAAGLEAIHGENILQADEPEPFAQWVVGLLADAGQRARLGQAGRRLVEARYAWSIISKELEAAYEVAMAHEDS